MPKKRLEEHIGLVMVPDEKDSNILSVFVQGTGGSVFASITFITIGLLFNWLSLSLIFVAFFVFNIVIFLLLKTKGAKNIKKLHWIFHITTLGYGLIFLMIPVYVGELYAPLLIYIGILFAGFTSFKSSPIRLSYFIGSFLSVFIYILLMSNKVWEIPAYSLWIEATLLFFIAFFAYQVASLYILRQKKNEKEKEEREKFLEQVLNISPYPIFTKNLEGRYTYANNTFLESEWVNASNISTKRHLDIFEPGDYSNQVLEEDRRVIETGTALLNSINCLVSKKGEKRWIQYSKVPIKDKEREVIGILCVAKDITQQKITRLALEESEAKLRQKNEELEKYIKSNMQLENFAYLASHDLKEPIRSIVSFSQLLEHKTSEKLDETEKEYISFIASSAKNMSSLIDDLLRYSLVNSENQHITTFNPRQLLDVIVAELSSIISSAQAVVKYENLPTEIEADRNQLKQVFQNLISNAIKFSPSVESPVVIITSKATNKGWTFSVADNGIGIKPEFHERIFLLFKRLHSKTDYEGTGIGLAICKKVVAQHNGKIWVESEMGKGSTFHFTIQKL